MCGKAELWLKQCWEEINRISYTIKQNRKDLCRFKRMYFNELSYGLSIIYVLCVHTGCLYPGVQPFIQVPLTWLHCDTYLQCPQSFWQCSPYFPYVHSIKNMSTLLKNLTELFLYGCYKYQWKILKKKFKWMKKYKFLRLDTSCKELKIIVF